MDLIPFIYHEKQARDGSMLCAQHCLNNLLQQNLYSAMDLADIATDLDNLENAELDETSRHTSSRNMDDSGFFSIGVLENALSVFDLELIRWRSEEMRQYQDKPEDQSSFILNLSSHWLPLRRFTSSPTRFYNLNSFLAQPEWISPTYLGLVLSQAEEEGYSVFVVRMKRDQAGGGGGVGVLPECEADLMGLELGGNEVGGSGGGGGGRGHVTDQSYASAAGLSFGRGPSSNPQASSSRSSTLATPTDPVQASLQRSQAELASFQRDQQAMLEAGRAMNAYGYDQGRGGGRRRGRQGDVEDMFGLGPLSGSGPGAGASGGLDDGLPAAPKSPSQMNRFERTRWEEQEEMRKAIEASLAEARERGIPVDEGGVGGSSGAGMQGGSAGVDASLHQGSRPRSAEPALASAQAQQPALAPATTTQTQNAAQVQAQAQAQQPGANPLNPAPINLEDDEELDGDEDLNIPNYDFRNPSAAYDDEDAALQAAIQASLMQFDGQLTVPVKEVQKEVERTPENIAALTTGRGKGSGAAAAVAGGGNGVFRPGSAAAAAAAAGQREATPEVDMDDGEEKKDGDSEEEDEPEPEPEKLTAEELRQKRLARFGA